MTLILVHKIPEQFNRKKLVTLLMKVIPGHFDLIKLYKPGKFKHAYLRLNSDLDPEWVVDAITNQTLFIANIPKPHRIPPDLLVETMVVKNIPNEVSKEVMFIDMVVESSLQMLVQELQYKYVKLYDLSQQFSHKLLRNITEILFTRLKKTANFYNGSTAESLTKAYRTVHPHTSDLQLIESSLHELQDEKAIPRTELHEENLLGAKALADPAYVKGMRIKNMPVVPACTDRIVRKLKNHIGQLNTKFKGDTEEKVATKKVRTELKNFSRYIPVMIEELIGEHTVLQKSFSMWMYGEPCLPKSDRVKSLLEKHVVKFGARRKHDNVYNLVRFTVPETSYRDIIALDGTIVDGCKLIVRPQRHPHSMYKLTPTAIIEVKNAYTRAVVDGLV